MTTAATGSFLYHAFGLCLSLPFRTNLLSPTAPDTPVDVHVRVGTTPSSLAQVQMAGRNEQAAADLQIGSTGEILWTTERARFWAGGGNLIIVEPLGAHPAALRRFILYTCLPSILNQRGLLALHANAVVGARGAIIIMGPSGAGKSTLLAALMNRGLPMLADDLTVLRIQQEVQGGEGIEVLPGYPVYRLHADALNEVAPAAERVVALGGERQKYLVRAPQAVLYTAPVPLDAIYTLETQPQDGLTIQRIQGMQAFQRLQQNCYAPASTLTPPASFTCINQVIQRCALYQLSRPAARWTADELAQSLLLPQREHYPLTPASTTP